MKLLIILATLALGAAWGSTWYFHLPPQTALISTGAILFLVLVAALVRLRRARAKKKKVETPAAPVEPAPAARAEFSTESRAMQDEFSRAVLALKTSKLSRGGRDALTVLPWYLVIGSPESGKSTALRNSGLKFPYLTNRGSSSGRSVGPTRHCDWWLTNEGVFLDAAGRYVTSEEDREEWFAFLDSLGKHRPQRPLNGLIVTVSVSELMGADPQAAGELGQRLRERIDELTSRLRVVVPIYVMITKCDLLTGFVETFSNLPRSERGQIWGFTVPLIAQPEAPTELLLKRFDELTTILEQRSINRVGQERRLEARERIYQFPQRFDSLRKNLSEFIQPLFMENVFQDTPLMRGVYFTSGTQEHRASDQRQTATSGDALIPDSRLSTEAISEGRSFFIWDVFTRIMFQDQKLAVRSSMEELRQRKRRYILAGASLALTLALLVLPTVSFFKNKELLERGRDIIVGLKLESTNELERIQELGPLQVYLAELHQYRKESAPLWMRMGMYKGDQIFEPAQKLYNGQLKKLLLGRQFERIQQSLELFAQNQDQSAEHASTESYGKHFDELKMYLLVTEPREREEPMLDDAHQHWLVQQIVKHWEEIRGGDGVNIKDTITPHAETYISMLAADPKMLAYERDEQAKKVVVSARRALNSVPVATLELERIIDQANREYGGVSLIDAVGSVPLMRAKERVPGAFTRLAWEERIRARMDSAFQGSEAWVLKRDAKENEEQNRAELRTRYYERYIQAWLAFLYSVRVEEPKDWAETELLLGALTRGEPTPLEKLFKTLQYNVHLELPKSSASRWMPAVIAKVIGESASSSPAAPPPLLNPKSSNGVREMIPAEVETTFSPFLRFSTKLYKSPDETEQFTQLQNYRDRLRLALNALKEAKDKPTEDGLLAQKVAAIHNEVELIIQGEEGAQSLLQQLLLPPFKELGSMIRITRTEEKSRKWCEDIFAPFKSQVGDKYPFNKNSLQDAPLLELTEFLHPSTGAIRKFLQTQLADDVRLDGRRWVFPVKSAPGKGLYKDELLTYLDRVTALSTTLFPGDTVDPLVRFTVRMRPGSSADASPSDIASITLTLDGTEEIYRNGPDDRWRSLTWPGPAGKLGAYIHVVSTAGNSADLAGSGEWGLFRLLESAKTIEPSPDGRFFTATWEIPALNNAQVAIDIRPERLANPFFGTSGNNTSKLFEIFRDPRLIPPQGIGQNFQRCPPPAISTRSSP